jgi:hypothetical protein
MPIYSTSDFAPLPEVAIPAKPAYFFGSLPVTTDDTYMRLSRVSLATNVATVTGTIYRGNIPVVGNFITVAGSTASSGAFNVNHATITGVTGTASTGVYAITYALTHADVGSTTDAGQAIIPIAEVGETAANGTSVAIYVPSNELRDLGQKSITVSSTFPSLPTAATVTLYTAINNNPQAAAAEWTSMGVVGTVAAGAQTVGPLVTFATPAGRFFRVIVSGVTGGTAPTMIVKMVC